MKKFKKAIIFFICAALAVGSVACASDDGGNSTTTTTNSNVNTGNETDETPADEDSRLPFEPTIIDLEGRTFTFADSGWGTETTSEQRDVVAEEATGEPLNDAVYARNLAIEEMFNCTIAEEKFPWPGDMGTALRKAVNAGDNLYDAAYIRYGDNISPLSTGGFLLDLNQLTNMNLTQPWWDQNSVEKLSIANKLFAVTGDIQILDKGSLSAFVFNKKLQANYEIEDLYSLVKTGKWTLDKMLEISKKISEDLNGDGSMDENDRYGLLYYRDAMPAFLAGTDEYITRKDSNDLPYMSFNTEKVYSALESIYEVIYDETVAFHIMRAFGENDASQFIIKGGNMFQNDQSLLMYVRMTEIETLRGMSTDFGILPFPKYDENQKNHVSLVNSYIGSALVVPATADPEISGAVLEAMAYESRYTLIPAYYNVTLKTKVGRDEESSDMLDIIFGNITYDLGGLFRFGGIETELMNSTMTLGRTMASFYEKNEGKAANDIDKVVTKILELE